MKKIKIISLAALTSVILLTACSKPEEELSLGKVNVTHASPNAPGVDLLIDGTKKNTSPLNYPSSTGYLEVPAGTNRNFKVNVSGTSNTVINVSTAIEADKAYSVFAVDSVSKISALLIPDNLTAPASGKAHVRFIHLSPNAPAVDIALVGGPVVFPNKAFKQYTDFTPLDASTYNLEVRLAGTSTVVLTLPPITLTAGKIYTVFAKGFVGGTGSQALGAEIITNN